MKKILGYCSRNARSIVALIVVSLFVAPFTVYANVSSAEVSSVRKGSVLGSEGALAKVDGNVTTILSSNNGTSKVVFSFDVAAFSQSEKADVIMDIFEQQGGNYTLSIKPLNSRKFIQLPGRIRCDGDALCTSIKSVFELPESISAYTRDNKIQVELQGSRDRGSWLVLDALTLDQITDNPTPTPAPLVAVDDNARTTQDESVVISVLDNDSSGAGSDGMYIGSISNLSGASAYERSGEIVYSPAAGFFGETAFTYTAYDTNGFSDSATVTVNVAAKITEPNEPTEPGPTASVPVGSSMYWQLQGSISTQYDVDVYGIDLEDNENNGLIQTLQQQGKLVSCYISAGSYEAWRSDANQFDMNNDIGNPLGDWPGEFYLDINSDNVRQIMRSRIDRAAAAGCDALEPDNTDAYQASNGLGISAEQQIDYLLFLADYAHSKGLLIGLKNTVDLISRANLAASFDYTLNESCYVYNECDTLKPFIELGKAVFIAMYGNNSATARCEDARANNFHLAFYGNDYALDGSVYSVCD